MDENLAMLVKNYVTMCTSHDELGDLQRAADLINADVPPKDQVTAGMLAMAMSVVGGGKIPPTEDQKLSDDPPPGPLVDESSTPASTSVRSRRAALNG